MQKLFTGVLMFIAGSLWAQAEEPVKYINYCGKEFQVPDNCTATSENELSCNSYIFQWLYMTDQMMQTMPEQFISQLKHKVRKMKKEPIECVSLGYPMEAYKLSYKNRRQMTYKIVAHGPVNGQPVMVILSLQEDPVNTKNLPPFVQQIIQVEERKKR